MIQKIGALRPEQRAIVNTAIADEAFGSEAMKKQIASMGIAADLANRKKALDIEEMGMGLRKNLVEDAMNFGNEQERWGTAIGIANLPLAGYFGYKQANRNMAEAEATKKHRQTMEDYYNREA
jgi:hypothetical protein